MNGPHFRPAPSREMTPCACQQPSFVLSFFVTSCPFIMTDAASGSVQRSAQQTKYTSLASLMEQPAGSKRMSGDVTRTHPTNRHLQLERPADGKRSRSRGERPGNATGQKEGKKGRLSPWKMMALTVSMGGSQVSSSMTLADG